ncbi:MAG: TetR/AcrR family transcriptional regulator [Pseudomonadota bacterium]|nr:TetR/AcrR family transcriptional regulator [Pseudomonadota bacterium]
MKQASTRTRRTAPKAERTKASILSVAENYFSKLGFAATRLEDIADELGMTRAALFYHFKDKQMLYDAMVAEAFSALNERLEAILGSESKTVVERLELAIDAWVDSVVSRPNLARLILRFVADGTDQPTQKVFVSDQLVPAKYFQLFHEGRENGELSPLHDDPIHVASTILGTTVFYVAALSALLPNQFEPLEPEQVEVHRQETLYSARRLLGIQTKTRRKRK